MHIFDTCSNRINKGINFSLLYGPILITYGTPDNQVSQILAASQRTSISLFMSLWDMLWSDDRFDPSGTFLILMSPPKPVSSPHCCINVPLQTSHPNPSSFAQKILASLFQAHIPFLVLPPLLSCSFYIFLFSQLFYSISLVTHFKFVPISSLTLHISFAFILKLSINLPPINSFTHPSSEIPWLSPFHQVFCFSPCFNSSLNLGTLQQYLLTSFHQSLFLYSSQSWFSHSPMLTSLSSCYLSLGA